MSLHTAIKGFYFGKTKTELQWAFTFLQFILKWCSGSDVCDSSELTLQIQQWVSVDVLELRDTQRRESRADEEVFTSVTWLVMFFIPLLFRIWIFLKSVHVSVETREDGSNSEGISADEILIVTHFMFDVWA